MSVKQKQMDFELKSLDPESGCFEGYANTFNFKDHAGDITMPGAFADTIKSFKQRGKMPKLLWQHKMDTPIGVWTDMYEDQHGLYAKGQFCLETQQGREAYALMKMGALDSFSIGYITEKESYDSKSKANLLHKLQLLEVSVVSIPCNAESTVTVIKAFESNTTPTERELEKALRDLGMSRKQAKSFLALGYKSFECVDDEQPEPDIPENPENQNINTDAEQKATEILALLRTL
ncbi:HK97 family phage prohead protease [Vibrio cholerae]|uniref:HK97 family phage prohead protease n=1 Tax=Vibrio cholerae TaxID=666 RepID=UPI001E2DC830|nr:HK97 family phage prohead protease [Vibrio cholerae]EJL6830113.1 HK97 family phage prohead protease [Vibrio cholerae]EJL7007696.1 HK97 family phage prohead protease [Vibrio cholerae]EKF9698719.1 HK97 family phage prohead protease [Vibrio cholerae]ELS9243383.1 HK97 family phage prohead protease [Vibrio cholerae]MCD1217618.1 HK97 family phage prohead protease [Vibrio cholerae]